ncbi:hypothetical protein [Pseudomonas monsensis]|uniref:hypothetical protein n=1 Tax=Pseudomonas monsensis TaxID=2745509 RepID=UPI002ABC99D9|nr:hypothetical protein [Pseudomonas monsensis]MDZ3826346.1 hypothetical protein [Pseudomonas monsensis]
MTDNLNIKLDAIFDAREKRIAEVQRVRREIEAKKEEHLEDFLRLQGSVIRPTLTALANNLIKRGHEAGIFESADGQKKGAQILPAGTGIKFYRHKLLKTMSDVDTPYLWLLLDKATGRVEFHFNTSSHQKKGESGVSKAVDLSEVTSDLIHEEALKVIELIYS